MSNAKTITLSDDDRLISLACSLILKTIVNIQQSAERVGASNWPGKQERGKKFAAIVPEMAGTIAVLGTVVGFLSRDVPVIVCEPDMMPSEAIPGGAAGLVFADLATRMKYRSDSLRAVQSEMGKKYQPDMTTAIFRVDVVRIAALELCSDSQVADAKAHILSNAKGV